MNISLSSAAASKKKKKTKLLGFGLNARSGGGGNNVFGDDDDDDESDKDPTAAPSDARAVVNQALRKEQDALRQRAQKELQQASAAAADIYDYDAAYESFQPEDDKTKINNNDDDAKPKESRYIAKLLQTAQERQLDRDIAYERKVAREQQQEEEADVALRGKERFVTASYKRKLEERKLWQDKRATDDDGGNPKEMANFYGNLTHNVAMGGGGGNAEQEGASKEEPDGGNHKLSAAKEGMGFLDGFAKGNNNDDENDSNHDANNEKELPATPTNSKRSASPPIDPETRRQQERQKRQDKVAQARIRYLQRHGIQAN